MDYHFICLPFHHHAVILKPSNVFTLGETLWSCRGQNSHKAAVPPCRPQAQADKHTMPMKLFWPLYYLETFHRVPFVFYHIFNKATSVLSRWHFVLRTKHITIEVKLCAIAKMSVWQPSIDVPFQRPAVTSTIWTLMLQGSSVIQKLRRVNADGLAELLHSSNHAARRQVCDGSILMLIISISASNATALKGGKTHSHTRHIFRRARLHAVVSRNPVCHSYNLLPPYTAPCLLDNQRKIG